MQTVISSIVKGLSKRGVKQEEDIWKKFFTKYFNYEPRFNNFFSRNNLPRLDQVSSLVLREYNEIRISVQHTV